MFERLTERGRQVFVLAQVEQDPRGDALVLFDADAEKIRNEIIRMLTGPGRKAKPAAANSYGLSDAVKCVIGELISRGWTVRPPSETAS